MAGKFRDLIAHVMGGRRYCFVVMSYHEGYAFFERIRQVVAEVTGFECIRADDLPQAGQSLRQKIHDAIENAVFVIADVSEDRPNIYYEVGYAAARSKPILLVAREGVQIHTDLIGLEIIRYADNREGWPRFERALQKNLDQHKDSNTALIRAMVLPRAPKPSFILLNPKQPKIESRDQQHPRERRTYGDYLCLSGVMSAFVSVYGEHCVPEIISASHADDSFLDWDANLYLIGSPKVNRFTHHFMKRMQVKTSGWTFDRCPGDEPIADYEMRLSGTLSTGYFETSCGEHAKRATSDSSVDYGLILRGPHPRYPGRMVLILAGPHSMGTAAAGLAATKPQLLKIISDKLSKRGAELRDQSQTLWVLVEGSGDHSGHIDVSGVKVIDVGVSVEQTQREIL